MPLTQQTDVNGLAQARFLAQFQGKPLLTGIIAAHCQDYQDLENAFWSILTGAPFPNAVGDALTRWGNAVGEPRISGESDSAYRPLVQAQIFENASNARAEDVLNIMRALGAVFVRYSSPAAATMLLEYQGTLEATDAQLKSFLAAACAPITISVTQYPSTPVFGFAGNPNASGFNVGKLARTVF